MSGWMNCCKKHLKWLKKDTEKNGYVVQWYTDDADKRCRCDVKGCKERAYWEVGWGDKSINDIVKEAVFVPLKL